MEMTRNRLPASRTLGPRENGAALDVSQRELLLAARGLRMDLLRQLGRADEVPYLPPLSAERPRPRRPLGAVFALALIGALFRRATRFGSRVGPRLTPHPALPLHPDQLSDDYSVLSTSNARSSRDVAAPRGGAAHALRSTDERADGGKASRTNCQVGPERRSESRNCK
jgi:hypothetical protein